MPIAYGFYQGVFYPGDSPLYDPHEEPTVDGACFAPVGQPENYRGFLYTTAELREDYYLHI